MANYHTKKIRFDYGSFEDAGDAYCKLIDLFDKEKGSTLQRSTSFPYSRPQTWLVGSVGVNIDSRPKNIDYQQVKCSSESYVSLELTSSDKADMKSLEEKVSAFLGRALEEQEQTQEVKKC